MLGDRILGPALDLLEALVEAAYTRDKTATLRRANLGAEKLRHLLRLAHELGLLHVAAAMRTSEQVRDGVVRIGASLGITDGGRKIQEIA